MYSDSLAVPVSKPSTALDEGKCLLVCSVEAGEVVNLTLHRDTGYLHSFFAHCAPVRKTVRVTKKGEYTCEATNPVSNQRASVNLTDDHCSVAVSQLHVSVDEEKCSVGCSVKKGTDVLLSVYQEDGRVVSSMASSHDAPLSISVGVEKKRTYTCEASNSVSNEKTSITVDNLREHCTVSESSRQPVQLIGAEGNSVTFPAAVKNNGNLMYKNTIIGDVTDGQRTPVYNQRFTDRLQWDSSNGLFSITDLKMEDSGEYKVRSNDGGQIPRSVYTLAVYVSESFGKPVELSGAVGSSFTFPAAVKNSGSLMYNHIIVGHVTDGQHTPVDKTFTDRVQWDSSTGFFSITSLRMDDSGEYTVQDIEDGRLQQSVYHLTVCNLCVPVDQSGGCTVASVGCFIAGGVTVGLVAAAYHFWQKKKPNTNAARGCDRGESVEMRKMRGAEAAASGSDGEESVERKPLKPGEEAEAEVSSPPTHNPTERSLSMGPDQDTG
ncbi:hypothetical protein MATL_G00220680 [Megalops atlanticus]|uniref:Immunoglobulin domain-containing protein n=1 Tax=Megalops atlanticus TaxID=7932 RepID=A0A9D3PEU3_MEGAT|nr:hypothetical protein MATL_G00220680 [Megalops atlanticus]